MSKGWTPSDVEHYTGQKLAPLRTQVTQSRKRTKYGNTRTQGHDGRWYDSGIEAERANQLILMEKAGLITELELEKRQLRYPLVVNEVYICSYEADARYQMDGQLVVEDTKGVRTPLYRMKKQLMKAVYGIEIREVTR